MDHRTQTPPQRTLTIELGDLGAQNVLDDWKSKVLETLFDLPPDIIASYPGISAYCQDLESRFEALNVPLYESGWAQIRHQYTQAVTSCWPRFYAVLLVLREASNDQTMGSIWEQLRERNLAPTERERYTGERYEFFIPFAVICWATSWLDPLIPETKQEEPAYFCQGEPDTPGQPLRFSFFREAIGIFQTFKPSIWEETYDAMDMISYDSENLYEFVLNYHSLWENGNIRIKWVNALGQHLHFDPVKRQLSFFKFPSFCALKAIRGSSDTNGNFLERVTRDLELPESLEKRTPLAITMNQEVLLSYRLLFGSSAKSRKLAKEELTNLDDGNIDSLLIALCQESKPDIFSFLKKNSTIQELPSRSWPKTVLGREGTAARAQHLQRKA